MKKLAIDAVLSSIEKEVTEPKFYYKHFIQFGEISYVPMPKINFEKAVQKIYKVDEKAGKIADSLADKTSEFDLKNIFHHIEYRMGKFPNYVPSKPLLEVLSKIKVDMPCSSLPIGKRAYFDLGGFMGASYIMMTTFEKPEGGTQLKITVTEKDVWKDSIYFGVDLTEDNLEKSVRSMPYSEMVYNPETKSYDRTYMPVSGWTLDVLNLASNLFTYVTNPNEDFKVQYNQFSKNNKEAQKQKQIYTERPFITLGDNVEFLRLVRENEAEVSGHFRWQPCGVGRMQRKLIFIKPHTRNYKIFEGV